MAGRLEGKVVFITGVARGQGRSHAVRFAEEGADVIGIDICANVPSNDYPLATEADLEETAKLIEKTGRKAILGVADVRDPAAMKAVLDRGVDELGRLDFTLANAGIMPLAGPHQSELQTWQDCLDILLTGVLSTIELTYPIIQQGGRGGAIVATSSMGGIAKPMMRTEKNKTMGMLGYTTCKFALQSLTRNYASFLAAENIRVNTVHPTGVKTGMIENEMMANYFTSADPQDLLTLVNAQPIDAVEASDISNTMLFLCSDDAKYITGSAFRIDAGAEMR